VTDWKAEAERLADELAKAARDSERLDILEKEIKQSPILMHNSGETCGYRGLGLANTGRSLRQAIDDLQETADD